MNLKKIILNSTILLFIPIVGFANGTYAPSAFDGAYVGLGANALSLKTDADIDIAIEEIRGVPLYRHYASHTAGQHPIGATLFGGYGKTYNKYYVGGELYGRLMTSDGEKFMYSATLPAPGSKLIYGKIQAEYTLGGTVKLGYIPYHSTMLYGLLGLEYSKFHVDGYYSFIGPSIITQGSSYNYHRLGIAPGIGIAESITDRLILNLQYVHTWYGSHTHHDKVPITILFNDATTKTKTCSGVVTLGLAYKFNI